SRRRHTRSKRDWSSDVCSSDLKTFFEAIPNQAHNIHSYSPETDSQTPISNSQSITTQLLSHVVIFMRLLLVSCFCCFDALSTNFFFKLFPNRLNLLTPLLALFFAQVNDLGFAAINNGLLITLVKLFSVQVHFHSNFIHDAVQLCAHIFRQSIPELSVSNHHVLKQTMI